MNDEAFEEFLTSALDELWSKQDHLEKAYGFGSFARWSFDQESGKLEMFDADDKKALEADVVAIGSYASDSSSWKWAWSNESLLPAQRAKAESFKVLGELTGIGLFTEEAAFSVEDENMAWELAAMCIRHLGAMGVYKAPSSSGPLSTFLAITAVRH